MLLRSGQAAPFASGFAATADASISFDGRTVLFAGKQTAEDSWEIWTAGIDGGAPHRVLSAPTDLIRPLWLPAGRIVYARRISQGFALETAALDGSAAQRLSFVPGNFIPDDVLRDGRILFESGFPLGSGTTPELYLMYADGSGVESVRCDHGSARAHGREVRSGDIIFTHGQKLGRFTSALANEGPVAAPPAEYAGDIAELNDGRWIVSARKLGAKHFAIAVLKPVVPVATAVVSESSRDLVEPVLVAARDTPKHHPTALHNWATGNLLALNARLSRSGNLAAAPASVRAEGLSAEGQVMDLGTAPVESDGSFFI